MLPQVRNCLQVLSSGVQQVQILDGTQERSLLLESLAPNAAVATLLVE
jgi:acetylglutamate kinase